LGLERKSEKIPIEELRFILFSDLWFAGCYGTPLELGKKVCRYNVSKKTNGKNEAKQYNRTQAVKKQPSKGNVVCASSLR